MIMLLMVLGYNIIIVYSVKQVISLIEVLLDMFDYVMVDLYLFDVNGYDLIKVLLKLLDGLIFIIISGVEIDFEVVVDLFVLQFLLKLVSCDDLLQFDILICNK